MRVPPMNLWTGSAGPVRAFLIADVFTSTPLEGNQLGIFPDGRGLDDDLMLKVTRELHFSETVFFLPPAASPADAHVRIFTPGGEIPFAGHPTLGSAWVLGEILGSDTVVLATGAGLVPVELERDGDAITFGWMSQPIPSWTTYDRADELCEALGVSGYGLPIEVYDNGPLHLYVELPSGPSLAALAPDMAALDRLAINVSCFAQTSAGWSTRVFAPHAGIAEDPATGSSAGPLAVHLARHGRIKFGVEIEIRQGEQIHRPSVLYARADGAGDAIERVAVGGRAVLVARGEYQLTL
jgi:trans-2,3-dihydro-3-hydroxyanthranilate isomerase